MRTYWILERQWVAGMAMVAIGSVWFVAELWNVSRTKWMIILRIPIVAFIVLTTVSAVTSLSTQVRITNEHRVACAEFRQETRSEAELQRDVVSGDAEYIYVANVNTARGELVWTMYVDWYDNLSGMRPEFREINPSWTDFLGETRIQLRSGA